VRITLVHNPSAGDGRPSGEDLETILSGAGYQVDYQTTDGKWKKALQQSPDLVVAAGGDGTVRKVAVELAGRGIPFTVVPLGTANNIAKTFGIHGTLEQLAADWKQRPPTPLDLGVVSSPRGEARFVEGFGGGVFAELIERGAEEVEDSSAILGRETDRAVYLLRDIVEQARPMRWDVEVDGQDAGGEYIAVEILNMRFGGPNVPLAPEADPGDGELDVVLIDADGRQQLLDYLTGRLTHAAGPLPRFDLRRARHVTMLPHGPSLFHLDDELWTLDGGDQRKPDRPGGDDAGAGDQAAAAGGDAPAATPDLPRGVPPGVGGTIDVVIRPSATAVLLAALP
jgi:diacylglycerol kinase (ATP)